MISIDNYFKYSVLKDTLEWIADGGNAGNSLIYGIVVVLILLRCAYFASFLGLNPIS